MKHIEIRCDCGAHKPFQGCNVDEILEKIDLSGWVDDSGGGSGWMPGRCPNCSEVDRHLEDGLTRHHDT